MKLFSRWARTPPPPLVTAPPPPPVAVEVEPPAAEHARIADLIDTGDIAGDALTPFVLTGPTSAIRQAAARRIEEPEALRRLLKEMRGKDKSVVRILQQKVAAMNATERHAAALAADIEARCAALERHRQRSFDHAYAATLERLALRWQEIEPRPDAILEARALRALEECRQIVAEEAARLAAAVALATARAAAEQERARSREAARTAAAAAALEQAQHQAELVAEQRAQEALRAELKAADEARIGQLGGLIRMASAALRDGHTKKAARLRRELDDKLAQSPALPLALARQMQLLDDKLDELKAWKDFAVTPKRLELIAQMESLVGATLAPLELSRRIKELQEDWRTMTQGIVTDTGEDWERFHRASQAAYQPCREYFEAQAAKRRLNLERRAALIERLQTFEADGSTGEGGGEPDFRSWPRVLREAATQWREHYPVERQANKPLQATYEALMGRLQARLDAWYERNVAAKRALVLRARQALELADGREATDAIKGLQSAWKATAPVPHPAEQALWKDFREACDAVFARRQQSQAARDVALTTVKAKAVELCESAERLVELDTPALLGARASLLELVDAFDRLDELPRADARTLRERFQRAVNGYEARCAVERQREHDAAWESLIEAGRLLHAYAWALTQPEPAAAEAARASLQTHMDGVTRWPKGGLKEVQDGLAKAAAASRVDPAERERHLRLLCIRAEIASGLTTPAEDESLRREYQVQRLVEGMGRGLRADATSWDALLLEWLRVGAVEPALDERVLTRLRRARSTPA